MSHFSFDDFRLEPANQRLWRGEEGVPLPPKAFDTLVYLIEHRGRLVTREELMQAIWPDSFVEGANLTVYISLLRKALGEEGGRRYIETVPRKGYRFTADVQAADYGDNATLPAPPPQPASRDRVKIWAASVGIGLVLAAVWLVAFRSHPTPPVRRVRLTSFGPELAVTAAAISPDGKIVAYSNPGGIFIQQIDTGDAHPLLTPGPAFTALSISWFPDGAKVLLGGFTAQADTPSLWEVQVMGEGAPIKLGEGINATVSPDGRQIAMSGSPHMSPPELSSIEAPEIRLIRPDGEGMRTLVTGHPGETFGPVAWMRGGRRLVWVRYQWNPQLRRNSGSIDRYDIDSASTSALLAGPDFTGDAAAVSGERIVYSQLLGANPSSKYGARLFAHEPDSHTSALLEQSSEPVAGLSTDAAGARLALRTAEVEHSVFVADLGVSNTSLVNIRRLTLGKGREDFPRAWTPDDQSVIFDSNRNGTWELFRQSLNATADETLVRSSDDSFTPRLSPDRSSFLYIDRAKNWTEPTPVSIMRTPVSGGPTQLVLKESGISEWGLRFECSSVPGRPCVLAQRQGSKIVFRTFDAMRGFDPHSSEVARVDFDPAHPVAWTLAPDGSKLAWSRWEASQARIQIVALDARSVSVEGVALRDCSHVHSLHWTADGKGWFLTFEWPASWTIAYADHEGRARVLARGTGTYAPDVFPSSDGRHVAFARQVSESNVWLLQDF